MLKATYFILFLFSISLYANDDITDEELKAMDKELIHSLNECITNFSPEAGRICGRAAVHNLECIMDGLHTEGSVDTLIADCAISTRIELKLLKSGLIK